MNLSWLKEIRLQIEDMREGKKPMEDKFVFPNAVQRYNLDDGNSCRWSIQHIFIIIIIPKLLFWHPITRIATIYFIVVGWRRGGGGGGHSPRQNGRGTRFRPRSTDGAGSAGRSNTQVNGARFQQNWIIILSDFCVTRKVNSVALRWIDQSVSIVAVN